MVNLITQYIEKHAGSWSSSFDKLSEFLNGMYVRRSSFHMPDAMNYSTDYTENSMSSLLRILSVQKTDQNKFKFYLCDSSGYQISTIEMDSIQDYVFKDGNTYNIGDLVILDNYNFTPPENLYAYPITNTPHVVCSKSKNGMELTIVSLEEYIKTAKILGRASIFNSYLIEQKSFKCTAYNVRHWEKKDIWLTLFHMLGVCSLFLSIALFFASNINSYSFLPGVLFSIIFGIDIISFAKRKFVYYGPFKFFANMLFNKNLKKINWHGNKNTNKYVSIFFNSGIRK